MESAIYCGMESDQSSEWNHGNAVYGIKPQGNEEYSLTADSIRGRAAVPYSAQSALIPYQAYGNPQKLAHSLRGTPTATWIKKEVTFGRQKLLLFWCGRRELNPYGKTTRPSNVRVCQFRHSRNGIYYYT